MDRNGARARRRWGRRQCDECRRRADARRCLSHTDGRLRSGRRDFRFAQSVRRQRHQGVFGGWREVHRAGGARGRGDRRRFFLAREGGPAGRRSAGGSSRNLSRTPARGVPGGSHASRFRPGDRLREWSNNDRRAGVALEPGIGNRRHRKQPRWPEHRSWLRIHAS